MTPTAGRTVRIAALAALALVVAVAPAGAAEVSPLPVATPVAAATGSPQPSPAQVARQQRQAEQARLRAERAKRRLERAGRMAVQRRAARSTAPPSATAPPTTSSVRTEVAGITIAAPQLGTPPAPPTGPGRPLEEAELQALLTRWTASRSDLGAMSVTVRQNGQSWTGSARNAGAAPDPMQRYRSLSVTKTITAALVLRQVELGTISLDAPLAPLTGVTAPVPPDLTVRQLLRHRSGLVDYNAAPGYNATAPLSPRDAVELSLRAPLRAPVDSVTAYTNSNYLYLGLLLEQVTGRAYADLVNELAASIGMPNTRLEPPDRPGWAAYSSGGVMSTTADLALWGEALTTPGRILRDSSLREMERFDENRTGLGMWTYCPCPSPDGTQILGHHTATGGLFIVPGRGLVIAMRADVEVGDTAGRARALVEAIDAQRSTR